jgi:hypothetical protein
LTPREREIVNLRGREPEMERNAEREGDLELVSGGCRRWADVRFSGSFSKEILKVIYQFLS